MLVVRKEFAIRPFSCSCSAAFMHLNGLEGGRAQISTDCYFFPVDLSRLAR